MSFWMEAMLAVASARTEPPFHLSSFSPPTVCWTESSAGCSKVDGAGGPDGAAGAAAAAGAPAGADGEFCAGA